MNREVDAMASKAISFPRVSGDEPCLVTFNLMLALFSPCERG